MLSPIFLFFFVSSTYYAPMKFTTTTILSSALLLGLALTHTANAQSGLFNNRGAVVYINTGGVVRVLGTVTNQDVNANMTNMGDFYIDNNFVNDSVAQGSGVWHVWGDWVNNRRFNADASEVRLEGVNQLITGDSLTQFHDLSLAGSGVKTQTLNSEVNHLLNLNDIELATDQFDMDVITSNTGAITRTTGFVSSLGNGKLYRSTSTNATYLFPTGSSVGFIRYRPAEIRPTLAETGRYGVRLVNNDPNLDGYNRALVDTILCTLDSLFYHRINRTAGSNPVDLSLYYNTNENDPQWEILANWGVTPNQWNAMDITTAAPQGNLIGLTHTNWNDFSQEPYEMGYRRPNPPIITGPDLICGGTAGNSYFATPVVNGGTYNWNVTGGTLAGGQGSAFATINWANTGSGFITATVTAQNGCISGIGSKTVQLYITPTAVFSPDTNNIFAFDMIHFVDSSFDGPVDWSWDFGDGITTTEQSPYHMYEVPGTYDVCLIVASNQGCTDTVCTQIEVVEGLIVPNVFTPDGDGVNDVFHVKNSGMDEYSLEIYNRWGILLFETTAPQVKWDGRTNAGEQVPSGVYYYVLKAKSATNEYKKQGAVQVLYGN